jgi:hypothetical protein
VSIQFLGLDKEHWDFINAFANWISALGTVGAVIVSLWLALRPDRISLHVNASIRVVIVPGVAAPPVRYVTITAVNRGRRLAKITGIGWTYGGRMATNRKHLLQLPGERDGMSSPIPVVLDDGQQAQWMFEKARWLGGLDKLYSADWRSTVDTFMVEVSTSVGRVFRVRVEQSLKDALVEAFREMDKASVGDPAVNP